MPGAARRCGGSVMRGGSALPPHGSAEWAEGAMTAHPPRVLAALEPLSAGSRYFSPA
jgi:hypothetical protein